MSLSKESADALRQCLRYLAKDRTPEQRRIMIRNVESYIAEGKWIPGMKFQHIARLFYPFDTVAEVELLEKMRTAFHAGELVVTAPEKEVALASDLAAWPECPQVPSDSPLRYWLPEWMQAPPANDKPLSSTIEDKTGRQDRRLKACEDAKLTMPKSSSGRLPDGISLVAAAEGVTRQTFSADVRAALERREKKRRQGDALI